MFRFGLKYEFRTESRIVGRIETYFRHNRRAVFSRRLDKICRNRLVCQRRHCRAHNNQLKKQLKHNRESMPTRKADVYIIMKIKRIYAISRQKIPYVRGDNGIFFHKRSGSFILAFRVLFSPCPYCRFFRRIFRRLRLAPS